MNHVPIEPLAAIWDRLVDSERNAGLAFTQFREQQANRVLFLRERFQVGSKMEAVTALRVLPYLPSEERVQFLDILLKLSFHHGLAGCVREIICSLPRSYVLSSIESLAEPYLTYDDTQPEYMRNGTDDEYRRLLELYLLLDRDLTLRLARRAAAHADPEIAEAGNDFLEKLAETNGVAAPPANAAPTLP